MQKSLFSPLTCLLPYSTSGKRSRGRSISIDCTVPSNATTCPHRRHTTSQRNWAVDPWAPWARVMRGLRRLTLGSDPLSVAPGCMYT
ncbi:hypothetical protein DM02DRAFT_369919 [Periconia macrospinosa]|uniref:Uncharacterized protein n=1 Tax=Periconia macrospinosa TaxID=97972 RepID=A0A2V1DSA6_9PLEO|nr:hypothetical protein DM02DRAFT_369919 [Periconia macrospinosa]